MSYYKGTLCLTGTSYVLDREILDTYVKPVADNYLVSEEIFKFLKDRYDVDHIMKRFKDKGSCEIKSPMGTYIKIVRG